MPASFADAGEFVADVRALETAGATMVAFEGEGTEHWIVLGAAAALTERLILQVDDARAFAVANRISHGRAVLGEPAGERWVAIAMPPDRASWTAALGEQEAAGATGVIVPWDPRLVDLLRNPDPDDRSDLLMSTG